jgi:hypothetical protein
MKTRVIGEMSAVSSNYHEIAEVPSLHLYRHTPDVGLLVDKESSV